MKVGDLVRIKNHSWGGSFAFGVIMGHWISEGGYDVWTVVMNGKPIEKPSYFNTHELLVLNESR